MLRRAVLRYTFAVASQLVCTIAFDPRSILHTLMGESVRNAVQSRAAREGRGRDEIFS